MSERKLEHCCECDCPTGRAGRSDDSLYFGDFGPFCEDCYDAWPDKINEEISQLRAQLAEAQKVEGTALEGRWYKHTDVYAPDGESWKEKYEAPQEGMVSVPVEPTDAMYKAFWHEYEKQDWSVKSAYKAMLKAAQGEG